MARYGHTPRPSLLLRAVNLFRERSHESRSGDGGFFFLFLLTMQSVDVYSLSLPLSLFVCIGVTHTGLPLLMRRLPRWRPRIYCTAPMSTIIAMHAEELLAAHEEGTSTKRVTTKPTTQSSIHAAATMHVAVDDDGMGNTAGALASTRKRQRPDAGAHGAGRIRSDTDDATAMNAHESGGQGAGHDVSMILRRKLFTRAEFEFIRRLLVPLRFGEAAADVCGSCLTATPLPSGGELGCCLWMIAPIEGRLDVVACEPLLYMGGVSESMCEGGVLRSLVQSGEVSMARVGPMSFSPPSAPMDVTRVARAKLAFVTRLPDCLGVCETPYCSTRCEEAAAGGGRSDRAVFGGGNTHAVSNRDDTHLKRITADAAAAVRKLDANVNSNRGALSMHMQQLKDIATVALRAGGNVLVMVPPGLSAAIIVEEMASAAASAVSNKVAHGGSQTLPVIYCSPVARDFVSFVGTCCEYLNLERQELVFRAENPFPLARLRVRGHLVTLTSLGNPNALRKMSEGPGIVVCPGPSAAAAILTERWGSDSKNVIAIADRRVQFDGIARRCSAALVLRTRAWNGGNVKDVGLTVARLPRVNTAIVPDVSIALLADLPRGFRPRASCNVVGLAECGGVASVAGATHIKVRIAPDFADTIALQVIPRERGTAVRYGARVDGVLVQRDPGLFIEKKREVDARDDAPHASTQRMLRIGRPSAKSIVDTLTLCGIETTVTEKIVGSLVREHHIATHDPHEGQITVSDEKGVNIDADDAATRKRLTDALLHLIVQL